LIDLVTDHSRTLDYETGRARYPQKYSAGLANGGTIIILPVYCFRNPL
jgi:hypothetical protein